MRVARPLTDKEYAECFDAFKNVSSEWMAIGEWLEKEFIPCLAGRALARVLSVGSGTGDFDLTLMRMLLKKIPHISYIALDPNEEHNAIFSERYRDCGLELDVTDCIKENETGRKILNFFLESDLEGIDRSLKEEIIQKMKEICRYENGRYFLFHPCGIFWTIKQSP
jgi:hypothetical protein